MALVFGPPVLADDDPVVQQVLRMCGATLDGATIVGGGGLTLTDVKAFLTDRRDEYRDFIAEPTLEGEVFITTRWWGADAVLHDQEDPIATVTAVPHEGYWRLADPDDNLGVIYIHGYVYDTYAAASDVLYSWAQHLKLEFDFSDGSGSYSRSQKVQNLLAMAERYKGQGAAGQVQLYRSDTVTSREDFLEVSEHWGPDL